MAKYSFIVPFYKKEKYLKRCIETLLDQDFKDIEVVVCFDGPNEEGQQIVSSFTDERLKSLVIEHGGACKARNEGFKVSTGSVVCFWDADCYAEPGLARVWEMLFEKNPDISFIYSGYKWTDEKKQGYESEEFNQWKLTCNNYICSMSAIKRAVFEESGGWDESLKSLQDWDLFLTIVGKGHKGYWNKGFAFVTEYPEEGSISFENCKQDVWLDRKKTVREKHGITNRDVCVSSYFHTFKGYDLAQFLNGDFDYMPSYHKHDYKMIYKLGFYATEKGNASGVFMNAPKDCIKVIHWMGKDVESLQDVSYRGVRFLFQALNEKIDYHFCETEVMANKLRWMGIKDPKVVVLPLDCQEVPYPEKFSVFYDGDASTYAFLESIKKAMPDIDFHCSNVEGTKTEDIACYLGIFGEFYPTENFKRFISAGRFALTNFQLPHSNFQSEENKDTNKYKIKLVEKIRELQKRWEAGERNEIAKKFWVAKLDKNEFTNKIKGLTKVVGK